MSKHKKARGLIVKRKAERCGKQPNISPILRWLGNFSVAPKRTFVVHGEPPASDELAKLIKEKLGWSTEIPSYGQKIGLV